MPTKKPLLNIYSPPGQAHEQGWGHFIPQLKHTHRLRIIHPGKSTLLNHRWRRIEPLIIRALSLVPSSTRTYFAWGDERVGKFKPDKRYFATIHQPPKYWPRGFASWCEAMGGIHLLSHEDEASLRGIAPNANIRTILHGINTEFWKPAETLPTAKKIVFSGKYMRNFDMFFRVSNDLKKLLPDLHIEMLLNPGFTPPGGIPTWIQKVGPYSAEELRSFYQSGTLMFMPYDCITASNSICEALSCGLPIVSTKVGGMPSYARQGGMILVENNDDNAALNACLSVLQSAEIRGNLSAAGRDTACRHLDWSIFSRKMSEFLLS